MTAPDAPLSAAPLMLPPCHATMLWPMLPMLLLQG